MSEVWAVRPDLCAVELVGASRVHGQSVLSVRLWRGATSTSGRRIASSQIDDPCQRWARVALPVVAEYTTGPEHSVHVGKLALRGL